MRYAAKRTWPDRPKAWEDHGEADSIEAFALAFASNHGLGVGTEFEVLDKDSDEAALVSYRVASSIPYTLGPVEARAEGQAPPAIANTAPFAASAMAFGFYMAKVALIIMVVMGVLFYLIKQIS